MDRKGFFKESVDELSPNSSLEYFRNLGQSHPSLPGLNQEHPAVKVYHELTSGSDILAWRSQESLKLEDILESVPGSIVELAGPTPLEFKHGSTNDLYSFSLDGLRQKAITTNLGEVDGANVRADALSMPFSDNSVKALICSRISFNKKPKKFEQMFLEAQRVLKQKGLFLVQGINFQNFQNLVEKATLQIILYELKVSVNIYQKKNITDCAGIFQKE